MKKKSSPLTSSGIVCCIVILAACGKSPDTQSQTAAPGKLETGKNQMSMKLNGAEWRADNNLFGAVHPAGYNKAIMMAGSKGPKNKDEQPLNINLFNADGPGVYHIKTGNADLSVAQLANLSPDNFMYGGLMGFDLTVTVTQASKEPSVIEATFDGTLTGNSGDTLQVTDGRFSYRD